ncbi:hypothetical protein JAAARDRAFT_210593 [Jaapia argillacea MUCL 33604]|uniref:CHAT domain-containing protein n=1 Tax=Jaapia argillacea MUCL 33604 TaxID=933084 RepID=A0A067PCI6_9AGAM|nr:hypothetical protein JAAARDRAFT_210593 [Jaapia argillacea MUCL 33604]
MTDQKSQIPGSALNSNHETTNDQSNKTLIGNGERQDTSIARRALDKKGPFKTVRNFFAFIGHVARRVWIRRGVDLSAPNHPEPLIEQGIDEEPEPVPQAAISQQEVVPDPIASQLHARAATFRNTGVLGNLEEAIRLDREALALRPVGHPQRADSLTNLAISLKTHFRRASTLSHLQEAVELDREALGLRPPLHPDRGTSLNNLAIDLRTRFRQLGDMADLDEALKLDREALVSRPEPHPNRSNTLFGLAYGYRERYKQKGDHADLEEAIRFDREALRLRPEPHSGRADSLNNLGASLIMRFEVWDRREDLDEALDLYRASFRLRPSHPERASSLNNLGDGLRLRFERKGEITDLEEAIKSHREAVRLRPVDHPQRAIALHNLAIDLKARFDQTRQMGDLEEALNLNRKVLHLLPPPHPLRSYALNDLAVDLRLRFLQTGERADLEEALKFHSEALCLRPVPHPLRGTSLFNMAEIHRSLFEETSEIAHLDEAVKLDREALTLDSTNHLRRASLLNLLAGHLQLRAGQTGETADLDESVKLSREALHLLPAEHPDGVSSLINLASSLGALLEKGRKLADVEELVELEREILNLRPHPQQALSLNHMAQRLFARFQLTGEMTDMEEAVKAFRASATHEAASEFELFIHACHWSQMASKSNHTSGVEAFQTAIRLLPRIAMLGSNIRSQLVALRSRSVGLASDAAFFCLRSGEIEKAVEFLEEGRSVFWSQALHLRTPLDNLKAVRSDLAQTLERVSRTLDLGSFELLSRGSGEEVDGQLSLRRRSIEERQAVLDEIRGLDGFQDFLLPQPCAKLQKVAVNDPVVMLIATRDTSECAAVIITSSRITHIPLHLFSYRRAEILAAQLKNALEQAGMNSELNKPTDESDTLPQSHGSAADTPTSLALAFDQDNRGAILVDDVPRSSDEIFRLVLKELWESVVEPVVRRLSLKESDTPPRLWWCCTGPFTSLPLHAAGMYNKDTTSECLLDYAVSSYTPTLGTLLKSQSPPTGPDPNLFKMLAVVQTETKGLRSLRGAGEELQRIERYVPKESLIRVAPASSDRVLKELPSALIVHFACHGQQNAGDPLESALFLEGGQKLKISDIMRLPLRDAALAFLSACQTAAGDEKNPDESMHLAAAMLFAGFRGVVATMWPILDRDGPEVAAVFYGHLFSRSNLAQSESLLCPDTTEAARALHTAVLKLRGSGASFMRWVPFVHYGL